MGSGGHSGLYLSQTSDEVAGSVHRFLLAPRPSPLGCSQLCHPSHLGTYTHIFSGSSRAQVWGSVTSLGFSLGHLTWTKGFRVRCVCQLSLSLHLSPHRLPNHGQVCLATCLITSAAGSLWDMLASLCRKLQLRGVVLAPSPLGIHGQKMQALGSATLRRSAHPSGLTTRTCSSPSPHPDSGWHQLASALMALSCPAATRVTVASGSHGVVVCSRRGE